MRNTNDSHGFLKKFSFFSSIHGAQPLRYQNSSIKLLHSLRQHKQIKPITNFYHRKTKKPFKSINNKEIDNPKEYIKDTMGKIYRFLKYSTWDSAKQELDNLSSIRWDSYTVNQDLKIFSPMEKAWIFFNWASKLKGHHNKQLKRITIIHTSLTKNKTVFCKEYVRNNRSTTTNSHTLHNTTLNKFFN